MKNKLGIKSRVFLSFSIFIILIVNIFTYLLYFFIYKNIEDNTNKSIISEYETIKAFIDLQKTNIFSLPKYEIEKLNNMGLYFFIGNNDHKLQENYKLGFKINEDETIFRGDYKGFNIIIGKNKKDFKQFKKSFSEIIILLNIILLLAIFLLSYFITSITLKPLNNLANFLDNYKESKKIIKNSYGNSEIGKLTNSINNFINKNNNIHESQINFIQDTSHELKTPLMQIGSNIELIEDKISDEKIKNKLNNIKNSANNINNIITNLSFILKGEEIPKNKEKINIYNYFSNLIKNYEELCNKKNIKINIVKNYDLVLNNNSYYLDRLFGNIVLNAIYYNKGNNSIDIVINNDNISISDGGIGISETDLSKIFSRFYRNKNSGLYYRDGNGLGLVIVKKICDMFGWKTQIKSEELKGTKFIIMINNSKSG